MQIQHKNPRETKDLRQGKRNTHVLMTQEGKSMNYIHSRKKEGNYSCRAKNLQQRIREVSTLTKLSQFPFIGSSVT